MSICTRAVLNDERTYNSKAVSIDANISLSTSMICICEGSGKLSLTSLLFANVTSIVDFSSDIVLIYCSPYIQNELAHLRSGVGRPLMILLSARLWIGMWSFSLGFAVAELPLSAAVNVVQCVWQRTRRPANRLKGNTCRGRLRDSQVLRNRQLQRCITRIS